MARQARDRSQLKVYHAMLRGVNKQQIIECTEDYEQFVRILQRTCGLPVETRPSKLNATKRVNGTCPCDPVELRSNIISEPSLADEEYYTCIDAGSFEQYPDYWRIRYLSLDPLSLAPLWSYQLK